MTDETMDHGTELPSVSFPLKFEGTNGIGPDFSVTMKISVDSEHGLKALEDMKAMPRGTWDGKFTARQTALKGDSVDREWERAQWANMDLQGEGDPDELHYEKLCIGSRCPVFTFHTTGSLAHKHVCEDGAEVNAFIEVVFGETGCPRYPVLEEAVDGEESGSVETAEEEKPGDGTPGSTPEEALADTHPAEEVNAEVEEVADAAVEEEEAEEEFSLKVVYPDDGLEYTAIIGKRTRYGNLISEYLSSHRIASGEDLSEDGFEVRGPDDVVRSVKKVVRQADYGQTLRIVPVGGE